ncbi:LCP2, partial [Symbiodinium sp. KB8]
MVRSAAAVVAGNSLVAATLIDSWLPWRTLSSGIRLGYPNRTIRRPLRHRVIHPWELHLPVPLRSGGVNGISGCGWALYLLDKLGVISFGRYWPVAGWHVRSGYAVVVDVGDEGTVMGINWSIPHSATNRCKFEEEGLDVVLMIWSFASPKGR